MKVTINEDFSLRTAKKEDEKDIQELIFEILEEYGLKPETMGVDADLFDIENEYKDGFFGVVLSKNETIVGTCALYKLNNDIVEIRKMYLRQDVRSKGLGKWSLNYLIDMAKNRGFKMIDLETASPLVEAISLYTKFGFKIMDNCNQTTRCDKSFRLEITN